MITEAEEMKDADYPELRLFRVEHQLAPDGEKDDCQGRWLVCTPKTCMTSRLWDSFSDAGCIRN